MRGNFALQNSALICGRRLTKTVGLRRLLDSRLIQPADLQNIKSYQGNKAMTEQIFLQTNVHQENNKASVSQRKSTNVLQDHRAQTSQLKSSAATPSAHNNTGLPDNLKSGIENLSGMSMDHVQVHYNSAKPAQLNAHAYAQGSQIHLAPGQEKHLPHEAWHVVQQAQGRVKPTMQMKAGVPVNDDAGLEKEADVMGARALKQQSTLGET